MKRVHSIGAAELFTTIGILVTGVSLVGVGLRYMTVDPIAVSQPGESAGSAQESSRSADDGGRRAAGGEETPLAGPGAKRLKVASAETQPESELEEPAN